MFIKPVPSPAQKKKDHEVGIRRKFQAEDYIDEAQVKNTKKRRTERINQSLGSTNEVKKGLD